jgi:hypothetical protein
MEEFLVLVVVLLFSAIVLALMYVHYRKEHRKVGLEHEQHLRALELGRDLPRASHRESWFSPVRVGMMIGASVPLGAFICAMVTTICVGFHETIWMATMLVSLGSVISGAAVVGTANRESKSAPADAGVKPYVEEDAYDVVSARA